MTGSIFMTVGIAFERYTAIHYPFDYNQVSAVQSDVAVASERDAIRTEIQIDWA